MHRFCNLKKLNCMYFKNKLAMENTRNKVLTDNQFKDN